jgi:predicted metallopeptidase
MANEKSKTLNEAFITDCAKVLMDQYNLDEDKVIEILRKCSPKENPSDEQVQIMKHENLDESNDYSAQIHSIRNYFSPNFVLALRSMEPLAYIKRRHQQ